MHTISPAAKRTSRPFYGWIIVIGSFLIMATFYTMFINTESLFQRYVIADLGLTVSQYNLGTTISSLTGIIGCLMIGPLVDKISARIVGTGVVLIGGVVLFLNSIMTNIWMLYACRFIAGLVLVSGTRLLISVLVTNWFNKKQGFAVALALSGSGLGGAILSPVITTLITSFSWRVAYLTMAIVCVAITPPLVVGFFRSHPEDLGLEPYGGKDYVESKDLAVSSTADERVLERTGWKELRTKLPFWIMVLGFIAMGFVNGCVLTNQVSNMTSITLQGTEIITGGHPVAWASTVLSVYLVTVVIGKIITGILFDRFGITVGIMCGSIGCIIACAGLCFPQTDIGPIVAAVAFGFGTCLGTVAPPLVISRAFGRKNIGFLNGVVVGFQLFGSAIGTAASGQVFDAFHTFAPIWVACGIGAIVSAILICGSIAWINAQRTRAHIFVETPTVVAPGAALEGLTQPAASVTAASVPAGNTTTKKELIE